MATSKGRSANGSSTKNSAKAATRAKAKPAAKAKSTAKTTTRTRKPPTKAAPKAPKKAPAKPATGDLRPVIEKRAYEIWLAKGRPVGQDMQNWREAEQEVRTARR